MKSCLGCDGTGFLEFWGFRVFRVFSLLLFCNVFEGVFGFGLLGFWALGFWLSWVLGPKGFWSF